MTVTVPPRLARREQATAADAFLLRVAVRLPAAVAGCGPTPLAVFRVDGGFLLVPADDPPDRLPGAISLRRLAGDLYVPTDADLVPTLLPDELTALTREQGLVVLPGGAVLGFAAGRPLAPADWLHLPPLARGDWQPLPAPPPLADRLTTVAVPPTPVAIEKLLEEGGPDGRDPLPGPGEAGGVPDDARPPAGGPVSGAVAGAGLAAGKLLALLGGLLGSGALARAGADLVRRAVERVPRLSERVLGAQEAALRQLLRQLQGGDVEAALRRAPSAVADPDQPARVDSGSALGWHDTRYSLRSLLGGSGRASAWLGGGDVWLQLAAEYRRLADAAVARGDHRRAAYLHGVLLRDLHAAAAVLMKGGLYRDAAVIYRDKLRQDEPAARAFERAGDHDEAVRLYVRAGQDEAAGDLLLKLGLADRAAERFTVAADKLVATGRWVAAGDLLRTKLGDPAATGYYRRGWAAGGAEAVPCGERLFDQLTVASDWAGVRAFLDEAGTQLAPPRTADAGRFFNYARGVGDLLPADLRADLDDQARTLFAAHLREQPAFARQLFGGWSGPVVRDALFATRDRRPPAPVATSHPQPVQLTSGTVRAVAVARDADAVAIATDAAVVLWRMADGRAVRVCGTGGPRVVGLSVSPDAGHLFVLKRDGADLLLDSYAAAGDRAEYRCQRRFPHAAEVDGYWVLHPASGPEYAGGVRVRLDAMNLRLTLDPTLLHDPAGGPPAVGPPADLWLPTGGEVGWGWEWRAGQLELQRWTSGGTLGEWQPHWTPAVPAGSPPVAPVADWHSTGLQLELTGTDRDGVLHCGRWDATPPRSAKQASLADPDGFRAACLTATGRAAAVTAGNVVHWLRASGGRLEPTAPPTRLAVPSPAVAVVARPHVWEVAVLFADASAVRLPVPG